ncbi:MAG: hydroxylamine reductase [Elusimicrobia bacterium]|nr:hydroxylamine reductase [Elusimicrobiota bacterium]
MNMFCRQCEQTAGGKGCTIQGVCGKTSDTAILQDLLLHSLKGIGVYGKMADELKAEDAEVDKFIVEGLFTTVTNVNFNPEQLQKIILKSYDIKEKIKKLFLGAYKKKYKKTFSGRLPEAAEWSPENSINGLVEQGKKVGVLSNPGLNEDIRSLREILLYGLKGMAAYADHAIILGSSNKAINIFFHKGLAALVDDSLSSNDLIELIMEFGKVNLSCLEMLDKAHTEYFGNPIPTEVFLGMKKGPAIVVSGHDLPDLEELLKQTENKGVNIYTHGEMLPAHGYPVLKKYKHLIGHFGNAWQNQQKEFDEFPVAILMTTNCIQKPKSSYNDRIFSTGLVSYSGVKHIYSINGKKDFSEVIKKALQLGGFNQDKDNNRIVVGFAHNAVLSVADKIIYAIKNKTIRHFFLIGGCDGAKPGRNYYTEFAQKVPKDCVIITLACGKFRFNKLEFGDIGGIPRLLDCGQCNDSYSAIKIASVLAEHFKCSVNDLPLSFILSWYEQKAVCILLTLLSLGIKNIKLGPSLPAFISPNVLKILVEKFNIQPISTVDEDLEKILNSEN